jgi:hypothetical protein
MAWAHERGPRLLRRRTERQQRDQPARSPEDQQVADYFDDVARMRVGRAISRAVFDPSKL